MAESISVHFKDAKWDDVKLFLDTICRRVESDVWHFPKEGEWCLRVYQYNELLREYEDDALDRLIKYLGDFPTNTVCMELRRSLGDLAYDCATTLAINILNEFDGVVDDLASDCWTLDEISSGVQKSSGRFLDYYRSRLQR